MRLGSKGEDRLQGWGGEQGADGVPWSGAGHDAS